MGYGEVSRKGFGPAFGLGSPAPRLVPLLDDPVELRPLPLRFCARRGRLHARRCRLDSQVSAEQLEVRYLGALLRKACSSPGERGPQGSQRAPDVDLAMDERRLGGAPIRQILREGSGASRGTPRSQKGKGMPETVTWRILGMSLQKTSSDDRSDPTVASAHSRSSSQDWSSRSSSRPKAGSEASRVRNRSNWRRPSELCRTTTRLPPSGIDRASTPPSPEAPSADASAVSTSAATGRSPTGTAATSVVVGAGMAGTSSGLGTTSASAASPITMAASAEEPASGTCSTATGAARAPCGGTPCGRSAERQGPERRWPHRPASS
jgi:hypothetical protein